MDESIRRHADFFVSTFASGLIVIHIRYISVAFSLSP